MKLINGRIILRVLSFVMLTMGLGFLICLLIAARYHEDLYPFIWSASLTLFIALILHLIVVRSPIPPVWVRDAFLSVTLSWICISVLGVLPYLIGHSIPSFVDALFESVSGFTTTGSSILTNVEILPKSILFWRSLTNWIGGIGIIVLFIVIMPSLKMGGYQLFMQESSLQEKMQPRIQAVGYRLLFIYLFLTALEVLLLLVGKMSLFDSVCHSFASIATGGFSTRNSSIGAFSPYLQYVVMLFMFLSGTNFVMHYYLFKKQFTKVRANEEVRFYTLMVLIAGILLTFVLFYRMDKPFEPSLRESFFQVISIITCTGFATTDYLQWPQYAWIFIFFLMFLGGSTGSTAGGIKMARHLVVLKNVRRIFRQQIFPSAIFTLKLNNSRLDEETNNSILSFVQVYIMLFIVGTVALKITGIDFKTSAGAVATTMAGIGPGIGTVGPASTFAHLSSIAKTVLIFLMLTGRLEIYTFLVIFSKSFWRN